MNLLSISPTPAAPDGFPFAENHVRAQLGWNKDEMRLARKTRLEPADFRVYKKRVYLSAEALSRLSNHLTANGQKNAATHPSSIADDPQPVMRELIVCRAQVANPRMVLACPADENPDRPKTILRVRVKPGTVLRRRQAISGRLIHPYTDYYELIPPRFRRRSSNAQPATPI